MTNRREFSVAVLAGLTALAAGVGRAGAEGVELSEQQAHEALDPWTDALFTGDPAIVETVLAPEYQILRSDGSAHDKASYLKALPKQKVKSRFSDIVATGYGDVMVVRYRIQTDQTIDGKPVVGISPRLSTFRKENGRWMISSHANFAPLG